MKAIQIRVFLPSTTALTALEKMLSSTFSVSAFPENGSVVKAGARIIYGCQSRLRATSAASTTEGHRQRWQGSKKLSLTGQIAFIDRSKKAGFMRRHDTFRLKSFIGHEAAGRPGAQMMRSLQITSPARGRRFPLTVKRKYQSITDLGHGELMWARGG